MQKRAFCKIEGYKTLFEEMPKGDDILSIDKEDCELSTEGDFPYLHYHDCYEIGICTLGEGIFISDGEYHTFHKGDFTFIAPGAKHFSRALEKKTGARCRFIFAARHAIEAFVGEKELTEELASRIPTVIRAAEHPEAARELAELFLLKADSRSPSERAALLRISLFIADAKRRFAERKYLQKRGGGNERCAMRISAAAEYITISYSENASSEKLAALCHMSESQLRRNFISAYGKSPVEFRTATRVRVAKELLSKSSLTATEISERLGYCSPSDFSRAFKKETGISPSEYRKQSESVSS